MFAITVTPEVLIGLMAALLAIIFDWFPPVSTWYDKQTDMKKRWVMVGLLVLTVAAIYGGICWGLFVSVLACDKAGMAQLVYMAMTAAGINQGVHLLTKPESKG